MFSQPEHHHNLSLRLSQVLDDIGVNKTMILKRRRTWMLAETLTTIECQLLPFRGSPGHVYYFGSQTEGSTTQGLHSDLDHLLCNNDIRIIQDWSEWEHLPDKLQYMMVQDETTSPGYCLLQLTRNYAPLPAQDIHHKDHTIDNRGRMLLRHSPLLGHIGHLGGVRHGPAGAVLGGPDAHYDNDYVRAFHCSSWPKEADPWENVSGWPSEEMKKYSAEQGCFVVPVSSRTCVEEYQDLEWRISTSMAERCLMFNINTTQMSCYILMKMILKTFLKPKFGEAISSFLCKNILFHCIAESENSSTWNERSLLTCLSKCLQSLLNCILTDNCPHFMIPRNNLLAGKLSADVKHQLVDVMCSVTENIGQSLLSIQIDDLGHRLHVKSGGISHVYLQPPYDISITVASNINCWLAARLFRQFRHLKLFIKSLHNEISRNVASAYQMLIDSVFKLCQVYRDGNTLEQVAVSLFAPFLCSQIGSVRASEDIQLAQVVSAEAVRWFTLGLTGNSDICSGKLKLASALYCAGDLEICEIILDAVSIQLSQTPVNTNCYCYKNDTGTYKISRDFAIACYEKNEDVIKHNMAFCVTYLPCEVNCVPNELRFEMFRSPAEDRPYRGKRDYWMDMAVRFEMFRSTVEDRPYRGKRDFWMDWAVVDYMPYLYFLQYKVYTRLNRPAEQQQALDNLIRTIDTDEDLGHRETALNLLGQCMEQENRMNAALCCYMMSLKVRGRNNAAKWHICRLLAGLIRMTHD